MAQYFPTPFDFYAVMNYLGSQNSALGYMFTCSAIPTDAASYAANVTWNDSQPQPTWAYITTGAGWQQYDNYYQTTFSPRCNAANTVVANIYSAYPKRVTSMATRTLGQAFQVSSTRDAFVNYSVQMSSPVALVAGVLSTGQAAALSLQASGDNVTYSEIARIANAVTGTMPVSGSLSQSNCVQINGLVPAGQYVKLIPTGTVSFVAGQETLL